MIRSVASVIIQEVIHFLRGCFLWDLHWRSQKRNVFIIGMVEILPLSLWMLDVGITIIPSVDFEVACFAGVDGAHYHGWEGGVGLIVLCFSCLRSPSPFHATAAITRASGRSKLTLGLRNEDQSKV